MFDRLPGWMAWNNFLWPTLSKSLSVSVQASRQESAGSSYGPSSRGPPASLYVKNLPPEVREIGQNIWYSMLPQLELMTRRLGSAGYRSDFNPAYVLHLASADCRLLCKPAQPKVLHLKPGLCPRRPTGCTCMSSLLRTAQCSACAC